MGLSDIHAVDYTVILCSRLALTKAFYRDVMRFRIEVDGENWVNFRVGASVLALRPRGGLSFCDDGPGVPGSASVQLAFRVPLAAIDACHAEISAAGVPILREPTDIQSWRHRTLFFRDPEDNVIEIYAEF